VNDFFSELLQEIISSEVADIGMNIKDWVPA